VKIGEVSYFKKMLAGVVIQGHVVGQIVVASSEGKVGGRNFVTLPDNEVKGV